LDRRQIQGFLRDCESRAGGRDLQVRGRAAGEAEHGQFSDGETRYQILENVRGADVFVVQPCCTPVDFHLMQLLLMIDAFKRASAWRITPVIPYYPYARQDRKDRPRVAISAKLVADLLETAGSSRVLTLDLHAPQIQGYFNIPVDHLYAAPVLVEYFQKKKLGRSRWFRRMRAAWSGRDFSRRELTRRWRSWTSGASM
jgi:ribose-phosphate pyrophosphokinase